MASACAAASSVPPVKRSGEIAWPLRATLQRHQHVGQGTAEQFRAEKVVRLLLFCGATLNEFQPFQFQPVGANMRKVVLRLLNKPAFGAAAEHLGQSHRHFRRYSALFVHQFG